MKVIFEFDDGYRMHVNDVEIVPIIFESGETRTEYRFKDGYSYDIISERHRMFEHLIEMERNKK